MLGGTDGAICKWHTGAATTCFSLPFTLPAWLQRGTTRAGAGGRAAGRLPLGRRTRAPPAACTVSGLMEHAACRGRPMVGLAERCWQPLPLGMVRRSGAPINLSGSGSG